jgi:hypothetical protein
MMEMEIMEMETTTTTITPLPFYTRSTIVSASKICFPIIIVHHIFTVD